MTGQELYDLIPQDWQRALGNRIDLDYCDLIARNLSSEYANQKTIFPDKSLFFNALNLCPYDSVKCVILGQDPYFNENEAHGLSFSIAESSKFPQSLRNIFKEMKSDLNLSALPSTGNLTPWASQGVLLLNSVLSVEKGIAGSHGKFGWQQITDALIQLIAEEKEGLVFILWGKWAKEKARFIDSKSQLILTSAHPSSRSAYRDFWNSKPFSQCNDHLIEKKKAPICWEL